MRSISWFSTKAFLIGLAALAAPPAAAQYFDIYNDPAPKLAAAQAAYEELAPEAPVDERAARVSDLIVATIGSADYRGAYELLLEHQALPLHPDAVAGAVGHGLVAFAPDAATRERYIAQLERIAAGPGCRPCYARTFAAHHLARYYFTALDDLPRSIAAHERALALAREDFARNDPVLVNFLYQLAQYTRRIDLDRAQAIARETERTAFALLPDENHIGWLYAFILGANIAQDKGRVAEAADLWAKVADIGVRVWGEDDPNLLPIYQNTAMLLSQLGRTSDAVEAALMARANESYSDAKELADHRALIGSLLLADGRAGEAEAAYRGALALLDDVAGDDLLQAKVRIELAQVLSLTGAHDEALALMRARLDLYRSKLEPTNPVRRARETQAAVILSRAGLHAEAAALMEPVLAYNEGVLLDLYARDQDRAAIAADGNSMFRESVAIALLNGDDERAWRSAQLAVISDLAISAASLSYPGDAAGFTRALEQVRSAREVEEQARSAMAAGEGMPRALQQASAEREAAQRALASDYPDFADYLRPRPLTIGETQALLREDEAYIVPLIEIDRVVTLALTREGLAWGTATTPLHRARVLISRIRGSLDGGLEPATGQGDGFDAAAAHELYTLIFTPEIAAATRSRRKLIFPAGGPLAIIPPSVLLTAAPEAGQPRAFLIRDHAIALTPRLGSRDPSHSRAAYRFAGIGAPSLAAPPATRAALRGMQIDVESVRSLPSLPGALEELEALKAAFQGEETLLLTGAEATEAAVRQARLADYQILAFATHGLVSGQIAGLTQPALVMTPMEEGAVPAGLAADDDGLLTASEIADLTLAADWIILSACNTAAGEGPGAATYSGLARAFQLAGARSLLLSHWPVRDDVATRLSVATVTAAATGTERSEALRRAQLALIADSALERGDSPAVWAPFVLIE